MSDTEHTPSGAGAMASLRAASEQMLANAHRLQLTMINQAEYNATSFFEMMRLAAIAKNVPDALAIQTDYAREQATRTLQQMRALAATLTKMEG